MKSWWGDKKLSIKASFSSYKSAIKDWWNNIKKTWGSKRLGINLNLGTSFKNALVSLAKSINSVLRAWNSKKTLAAIHTFTYVPEQFAQGGFPKSADVFYANENGVPELVGTVGGRTAVASGTEITGISNAVYQTANEEIALLRTQNQLLTQLLAKDTSVNIGDREIARASIRGQRQLGVTLRTV